MSRIKEFLPPVFVRFITGLMYGWQGNYSTWQDAQNKSTGFDSEIIFEKVKNALLKVKNGEAVFERDSVLFDKVQYSFPLLSALKYVALTEQSSMHVLDFGGSMGSSYFQNKLLLEKVNNFSWNIIEQEHFVKEGKNSFADAHLNFYYNIEECLNEKNINTLLLASVLQYIEHPYELIKELTSKKFKYIIIDRTPIYSDKKERITIQKVPSKIYKAKYPCWILNEKTLLNHIEQARYELIFDSESNESMNLKDAKLKGYFFRIKE